MPLIKLRVMINGSREVEAIYDTGSNVSLINHKMIESLKLKRFNDPKVFRTISGRNFTEGRVQLKLKIGDAEEIIQAHAVKSDNFTFDLLLGLDAIKKFKLMQDEELRIHQKKQVKEESEIEKIVRKEKIRRDLKKDRRLKT